MKDFKYLAAYINPGLAIVGLYLGGMWTWANVLFVFGLIPIIDQLGPSSEENFTTTKRTELLGKRIFDWLLYLNLPIIYGVLVLFILQLNADSMSRLELLGNILSVGIVIGTCGINVGHELGHRKARWENIIAQLLLVPALYIHFYIEHNRGHHKHVATPLDPASAPKGQIVFSFWVTSTFNGYISAWKIESKRLKKLNRSIFTLNNQMIRFTIIQLVYMLIILQFTTWVDFLYVIAAGLFGVILLETINYLEHYGLRRKKLKNGRFEKVRPIHSWNANYQFGRIVLYELTRHSDHHFIASKKYQVLDHHDESPQLPFGYPLMILVSLIPPLWFYLMDKRIPESQSDS